MSLFQLVPPYLNLAEVLLHMKSVELHSCGGKEDVFAKVDCVSRLHANKSRSSGEDAEDFCVLDTTAN